MATKKTRPAGRVILIGTIVLAGFMAWKGHESREALLQRAEVQEGHTERLQRWKVAYEALLPVHEEWQRTFASTREIQDILGLYDRININQSGVDVSPETLVLQSATRVKLGGQDIGLNRVCLSSKGDNGLLMRAETFSDLLNGIENLAEREDIEIGRIQLGSGKDARPQAVAQDFCALLRDPVPANDNPIREKKEAV